MSEFKQCSNGHYYQGDHCPYCRYENNSAGQGEDHHFIKKICKNGHCYEEQRDFCPFCGEREVTDYRDLHNCTIWNEIIRFLLKDEMGTRSISINEVRYDSCRWVEVHILGGYKFSYNIAVSGEGINRSISADDVLLLGRTHMTGKEFIKMCDVIIDNQLAIQ